jgi:hypothetical protein
MTSGQSVKGQSFKATGEAVGHTLRVPVQVEGMALNIEMALTDLVSWLVGWLAGWLGFKRSIRIDSGWQAPRLGSWTYHRLALLRFNTTHYIISHNTARRP